MKRFAAFVTAILFLVLFTIPCFADPTPPLPPPPDPTPPLHQPVTL